MYRFVRLVDFIVMNMVRKLVINAVANLETCIKASFTGKFENDCPDVWDEQKEIICPPLFKISLLLCQGLLTLNQTIITN